MQPGPQSLFWMRFAEIGDICMSSCLYLDTSAVLRAVLESETSPEVEELLLALFGFSAGAGRTVLAIAKG